MHVHTHTHMHKCACTHFLLSVSPAPCSGAASAAGPSADAGAATGAGGSAMPQARPLICSTPVDPGRSQRLAATTGMGRRGDREGNTKRGGLGGGRARSVEEGRNLAQNNYPVTSQKVLSNSLATVSRQGPSAGTCCRVLNGLIERERGYQPPRMWGTAVRGSLWLLYETDDTRAESLSLSSFPSLSLSLPPPELCCVWCADSESSSLSH